MKTKLAVAMALVVAGLGVGFAPAPFAAAVSPDCDHDYTISDEEDSRPLAGNSVEVGRVLVPAPDNKVLTVTLDTNNDLMEFGIFEEIGTSCVRSDNVSTNCEDDVQLDTTGSQSTDTIDCTLIAPLAGEREFFVVFENLQSDSLGYTVVAE